MTPPKTKLLRRFSPARFLPAKSLKWFPGKIRYKVYRWPDVRLTSLISRVQRKTLESQWGVNVRGFSIDSLNLVFVRETAYVAIALRHGAM